MPDLLKIIKSFGLTEFYVSLSVPDKNDLAHYSRYLICVPENSPTRGPNCDNCFIISSGARFLWAYSAPEQFQGFGILFVCFDNQIIQFFAKGLLGSEIHDSVRI